MKRQPKQPQPHSFTEEQIRTKAKILWEQRGGDSTDAENWEDAIRALQREQGIRQVTKPFKRLWWKTGLGTPLQRWWQWTGIKEKKGWDLAQLLAVPLVLVVANYSFQGYAKTQDADNADKKAKQDRQLADDKAKQDTLVKYLDQMAESMKDDLLTAKPGDKRFIVAQARTVLALQSLDQKRQNLVIQFLSASGLNDSPDDEWQPLDKERQINPLPAKTRALLYNAHLSKANLVNSDLSGVVLIGANLYGANLGCKPTESQESDQCSDLRDADLRGATLNNAILNNADLERAILNNADLDSAILTNANLWRANLTLANLYHAVNEQKIWRDSQISGAISQCASSPAFWLLIT